MLMNLQNHMKQFIGIHEPCIVRIKQYRITHDLYDEEVVRYETTVGRALLSAILPKGYHLTLSTNL